MKQKRIHPIVGISNSWHDKANTLYQYFLIVKGQMETRDWTLPREQSIGSSGSSNGSNESVVSKFSNQIACAMLYAFAVEAWLKGIIIQSRIKTMTPVGELPDLAKLALDGLFDHDLKKIAAVAGIQLNEGIENDLWLLGTTIQHGRYPASNNPNHNNFDENDTFDLRPICQFERYVPLLNDAIGMRYREVRMN